MTPICIVTKGSCNEQRTYNSLPEKYQQNTFFFTEDEDTNGGHNVVHLPPYGQSPLHEKRQDVIEWARDNGHRFVVMADDDCRFLKLLHDGLCIPAEETDIDAFFEEAITLFVQENVALVGTHGYSFANTSKPVSYGLHNFYMIDVERIGDARYNRVAHFEDIDFILQVIDKGLVAYKLNSLISDNRITYDSDQDPERDEVVLEWDRKYPFVTLTGNEGRIAGKYVKNKPRIQWSWAAKNKHRTLEV